MARPSPGNAVFQAINRRAARERDPAKRRRYQAAAYETADVEANWQNPGGGDADSAGWRQERASLYPNPTNISASMDRFFRELAAADHGQPSYELAADVQRPRADLRGRYKDAHQLALSLLPGGGSRPSGTRPGSIEDTPARSSTTTRATFDQAGYDEAVKRQRLATFLSHGKTGGSGVLFRSGLLSTRPVDQAAYQGSETVQTPAGPGGALPTVSPTSGGTRSGGGVASAASAVAKKYGTLVESSGSNRGPGLDKLESSYGMVGQAWCGMFAGDVLKRMGYGDVGPWIASVNEIEVRARNHAGPFRGFQQGGRGAQPGDLVIPSKGAHVAVVERVDSQGIHVIGGNNSRGTVGRAVYDPGSVYGLAKVGK